MKKILLLTASILFFSCGSDDYNDDSVDDSTLENSVRLINDPTLGSVLTNADGFTLYVFAPDADGNSNCLDGCASTWPAFLADDLTLDEGLEATDFDTVSRSDGGTQTTYKGWPLYTFANDTAPGEINGDGSGGVWFVAKPDYDIMIVRSQLVGRDVNGVETNLTSSFEEGEEQTFYFTDDRGNTLYRFSNDANGVNTFTEEDFSNNGMWPIFHTDVEQVVSVLGTSGFAVIDVFGQPQLTYRGWPLYYFGGDENRGDNFGVGFPQAGIWPIVNQDTHVAPESEEAPDKVFEVTNNGASSYVFDFTTVENPELELVRGKTYQFNINAPGHPFYIKSIESTGTNNAYNDGVTNNGAIEGAILFTVPADAPDILFYNCEFHGSMTSRIRIVNEGENASFNVTNNGPTAYVFSGNGFNDIENTNFTFKRGNTYIFNIVAPGHPFIIKSIQGTGTDNPFNDGVTNNGVAEGTITFQVPNNAPDTLFYNCEFHGGMTGALSIVD